MCVCSACTWHAFRQKNISWATDFKLKFKWLALSCHLNLCCVFLFLFAQMNELNPVKSGDNLYKLFKLSITVLAFQQTK